MNELLQDNLMVAIAHQSGWLQAWVYWLMAVNTAAVAFWARREGRVVFAVWIGNALSMSALYWAIGYVRLLGLSHLIWWTPLLWWLWPRLRTAPRGTAFATWLWLLFASNVVSLAIDYLDVVRWLLGERTPTWVFAI